jgi:hypothetical protein
MFFFRQQFANYYPEFSPCQSTSTIRHHTPSCQRVKARACACARVAPGPTTFSVAGPFRRSHHSSSRWHQDPFRRCRHLPKKRSSGSGSRPMMPMSRVLFPHPCLSAVFECPSLSRCPRRTRRRIGDDLEFPRCRALGRTGGTGSSPWGSITRLSATTAHFELSRTDHYFHLSLSRTIMFLTSSRPRLCPRCVVYC